MNVIDILLLVLLAVIVAAAGRACFRRKSAGACSCCDQCGSPCGSDLHSCSLRGSGSPQGSDPSDSTSSSNSAD